MAASGRPSPPIEPPPTGTWTHPTGERLDDRWIDFARPPDAPATAGEAAAASLARPPIAEAEPASPERDYPSVIDLDDPIYGLDEDDGEVWFG